VKLVSYLAHGQRRLGLVVAAKIVELSAHLPDTPDTMLDLIARWDCFQPQLLRLLHFPGSLDLSEVQLLPPVPNPRKVLAIGLNYADHCAEVGRPLPTEQVWFAKAASSVAAPFGPIELPVVSEHLDHECELVAIVGKRCRNVPRERAKEVLFGYCAGNDVSVRDWQLRTGQWTLGKSFDTHAPIGPWITTADEVDPLNLGIRCWVNGELRQNSNTRHLIFDPAAQIEHLTKVMTLEPGDLLFTGTCGGVGHGRKPPVWLKEGDLVRVEIDTLGAIENRVQRGTGAMKIG